MLRAAYVSSILILIPCTRRVTCYPLLCSLPWSRMYEYQQRRLSSKWRYTIISLLEIILLHDI